MSRTLTRTSFSMTLLATCVTLLVAAAPALAHHRSDHLGGGGNPSATELPTERTTGEHTTVGSEVVVTEDDDTNDMSTLNNISDDGDNAHPSRNDRSIENGGSDNQGDAQSNPDDTNGPMRSEGASGSDEPNGPGGTDLADQDGNNGCGNDDDFNDDNNGNCGPLAETVDGTTDEEEDDVVDEDGTIVIERPGQEGTPPIETEVRPDVIDDPAVPAEDVVLGSTATRGPRVAELITKAAPAVKAATVTQGAALPFTGASLVPFMMVAAALIAAGLAALRISPRTSRR